jgi:hypothetical protein
VSNSLIVRPEMAVIPYEPFSVSALIHSEQKKDDEGVQESPCDDVLRIVFSNLPSDDLCQVRLCCHRFARLVCPDDIHKLRQKEIDERMAEMVRCSWFEGEHFPIVQCMGSGPPSPPLLERLFKEPEITLSSELIDFSQKHYPELPFDYTRLLLHSSEVIVPTFHSYEVLHEPFFREIEVPRVAKVLHSCVTVAETIGHFFKHLF